MVEKIVIIEKYFDNEMNFSSNIIEGIKAVLFFHEKNSHAQKAQKVQKAQKAQNSNKGLSLRCFLYAQKAQKARNLNKNFHSDVLYTHKRYKKHKKHKKHKA